MKIVDLFGNALLTGVSTWALVTTKSNFQYETLSYSFFLSIGVTGLLATATNNIRMTHFTRSKSQNSLAFARALLSTEICLLVGINKILSASNLLFPLLNMLTKHNDDEKMLEAGRWYNAVLMLCATHDLKLGNVLTFMLLLTDPKTSQFSSYLMSASIMLAVPCLSSLKNNTR